MRRANHPLLAWALYGVNTLLGNRAGGITQRPNPKLQFPDSLASVQRWKNNRLFKEGKRDKGEKQDFARRRRSAQFLIGQQDSFINCAKNYATSYFFVKYLTFNSALFENRTKGAIKHFLRNPPDRSIRFYIRMLSCTYVGTGTDDACFCT